jgi:hypothetical protein
MKTSGLMMMMAAVVLCVGCGESFSPAQPSGGLGGNGVSGVSGTRALSQGERDPQPRPFKGSFEGTQRATPLAPPFLRVEGEATGTATHLGDFSVEFPHTVNLALARGTGTYTFVAANGDRLTADFNGQATVGTVTTIVEEAVITGGTGRFANATGAFTAHRVYNPATGITTGEFDGTIAW